jgi:5'-deoxynucleotidase YfbR-like HD superfamily hydrolase
MKSQKLTEYLKNQIRTSIINYRFPDSALDKIVSERNRIAQIIFEQSYPLEVRKVYKQYPSYFANRACINFYYGDKAYDIYDINKRYPYSYSSEDKHVLSNKQTFELYQKNLQEFEKFNEDKRKARQEINAVFASVNTTKQLIEAWPEVEVFVPDSKKIQ